MSSITGSQQNSLIQEIEMIEELEKLVRREKRITKQKANDNTANDLQSIYLNYLQNLCPFGPQNSGTNRKRSESNSSSFQSTEYVTSPAFLISEPKQLDFNSNERQLIQSFINEDINEVPETCDTADDIQAMTLEKTSIYMERSTSPIYFTQIKSVQTDGQQLSQENYSEILNKLIYDLKAFLENANQLIIDKSNETPKVDNDDKQFSAKQTQTSKQLPSIKETFTQYESSNQSVDVFCQIEIISSDKITQTDNSCEQKSLKTLIDSSTQTDPLTDEEKSLNTNSYDVSVGEVPYISDDSSYC